MLWFDLCLEKMVILRRCVHLSRVNVCIPVSVSVAGKLLFITTSFMQMMTQHVIPGKTDFSLLMPKITL